MSINFSVIILLSAMLCACHTQHDHIMSVKYAVDSLPEVYGNYIILEQFPQKDSSRNDLLVPSSAYVCIENDTGDTVWILSPKTSFTYDKNSGAGLYNEEGVNIGDTLLLRINSAYYTAFLRQKKLVGTLLIGDD